MLLVVGYVLLGSGSGGLIPLQESIWATYFGRRYIGAVRSSALPIIMLFSAAGPLIVASSYDRFGTYSGALYGVAAGSAIAAFVVLFVRPPRHPDGWQAGRWAASGADDTRRRTCVGDTIHE